jgi:hypothetical protein
VERVQLDQFRGVRLIALATDYDGQRMRANFAAKAQATTLVWRRLLKRRPLPSHPRPAILAH